MRIDDYDGQMVFGELMGLKLPDICITGEEKPRKNLPRKLVPTEDRTRDLPNASLVAFIFRS